MQNFERKMQEAEKEERLDTPVPIPFAERQLEFSVKLIERAGRKYLRVDRFAGDIEDKELAELNPELDQDNESPWEPVTVDSEYAKTMLIEFVALADADDKAYEVFADKYGLLQLCDAHCLPFVHPGNVGCYSSDEDSLDSWRWLTRYVRAILNITSELHRTIQNAEWVIQHPEQRPQLGKPEDWEILYPPPQDDDTNEFPVEFMEHLQEQSQPPTSLNEAKALLSSKVNDCVSWAGVGLGVNWSQEQPEIELGGVTIWRYIAMQLLYWVVGERNWSQCSICHRIYHPDKKKRLDRKNFCGDKCTREGGNNRTRKHRSK